MPLGFLFVITLLLGFLIWGTTLDFEEWMKRLKKQLIMDRFRRAGGWEPHGTGGVGRYPGHDLGRRITQRSTNLLHYYLTREEYHYPTAYLDAYVCTILCPRSKKPPKLVCRRTQFGGYGICPALFHAGIVWEDSRDSFTSVR
eukprot:scaffold431_cov142-Skeletonema_menzelii.AAC.1